MMTLWQTPSVILKILQHCIMYMICMFPVWEHEVVTSGISATFSLWLPPVFIFL